MDYTSRWFQVAMPEEHLNGAQVGAGFEQMRGPTVTQGVRRDTLGKLGLLGGFPAGDPHHLVRDRTIRSAPIAAGEQIHLGFAPAPVLAQGSSSAGLSGRSRSLPPLPCSTRMIMRWLSMSTIFGCATSLRRIPVAYSV